MDGAMTVMFRVCQECGTLNIGRLPRDRSEKGMEKYLKRECRSCGSPALDYGSMSNPRLPVQQSKVCEVCSDMDDETPAVGTFIRTWHDGTVDRIPLCGEHAVSDPDGLWTIKP